MMEIISDTWRVSFDRFIDLFINIQFLSIVLIKMYKNA